MSKYVDKVVFNLHETFPKPKRGKIKDVLMGVYLKSFCLEMVYHIVYIISTETVSYGHNTLITSHNSYYRNTKKRLWKYQFAIFAIYCMLKDYQT